MCNLSAICLPSICQSDGNGVVPQHHGPAGPWSIFHTPTAVCTFGSSIKNMELPSFEMCTLCGNWVAQKITIVSPDTLPNRASFSACKCRALAPFATVAHSPVRAAKRTHANAPTRTHAHTASEPHTASQTHAPAHAPRTRTRPTRHTVRFIAPLFASAASAPRVHLAFAQGASSCASSFHDRLPLTAC